MPIAQYRRAIEDYERVKRLRPEMPNQPVDSQPENNDDLASFTELGRSYLEPRPLQSTPPAAPEPAPASVAPAPLSFTQSTASPADLPGAASTRPTASQPYIPQTKPPAFGPQAFFSKSVAADGNCSAVSNLQPRSSRAPQVRTSEQHSGTDTRTGRFQDPTLSCLL